MRIAHICLSCFFIDNRSYQENELVRQHVQDGHEVLVIASTETHANDGKTIYVSPGDYMGAEGARVVRLPYVRGIPHQLARKLRVNPGTYGLLEAFRPDSILFHGACGWEILTAARYIQAHSYVALYVDSHEDWNNSARQFLSRELLHKVYYRAILRRALPAVRKVLCISTEVMDFVEDVYGIDRDKLEFFPLGGRPFPDEEYQRRRNETRAREGIAAPDILFVQSGKQTRRKKLLETLSAFAATPDSRLRLIIAGAFDDDIRSEAIGLIESDPRVRFVGWRSPDELSNLLCAADVYLQPGTQSVTMQHSLCCRCAVVLDDVPAHAVYKRSNGWFLGNGVTLRSVLGEIALADLATMQRNSHLLACEMLDYAKLSKRVLQ